MSIEGKIIVFTGKISKPRHEFQDLVRRHGGIPGSDVSRNTDLLVVGEKPGSKLMRATMFGVKTVSEEEFLNLLTPIEEFEEPLTKEELSEIQSHIITLTCTYCNSEYKQWDTLPNYETCPVCEILSHPQCPHCKASPNFVTDFNLYHCMLCGMWFKAPYSIHARKTEHLHLFCKTTHTLKGEVNECPCGATLTVPDDYPEHPIKKYEPTYIRERCRRDRKRWVAEEERKWGEGQKRRKEEEEEAKKKEEEAFSFFKSLTPEQLEQLGGQLYAN